MASTYVYVCLTSPHLSLLPPSPPHPRKARDGFNSAIPALGPVDVAPAIATVPPPAAALPPTGAAGAPVDLAPQATIVGVAEPAAAAQGPGYGTGMAASAGGVMVGPGPGLPSTVGSTQVPC